MIDVDNPLVFISLVTFITAYLLTCSMLIVAGMSWVFRRVVRAIRGKKPF